MRALQLMSANLMKTDVTLEQRQKFRKINVKNKTFHGKVGRWVGGTDFFLALGFVPEKQEADTNT